MVGGQGLLSEAFGVVAPRPSSLLRVARSPFNERPPRPKSQRPQRFRSLEVRCTWELFGAGLLWFGRAVEPQASASVSRDAKEFTTLMS